MSDAKRILAGLDEALRSARCSHPHMIALPAEGGALTPKHSAAFCPDCGCHFYFSGEARTHNARTGWGEG